jgi:glycosyltransferase involved in cell wall biosynthesis
VNIAVIIPALNEESSIGQVLKAIPEELKANVIVVDNGSTDRTAQIAAELGASVVQQPHRGYGNACLRGMELLQNPDIVVFLDGDYSDYPEEMTLLIDPIVNDQADFVVGSRMRGKRQRYALPPHAKFANLLFGILIRLFFGYRFTDLGPFRAIRYSSLQQLEMVDRNFGWTVEMQIKAIRHHLRIREVPVSYRVRIGKSKISGTIIGSMKAGGKIIWTILKYRFA